MIDTTFTTGLPGLDEILKGIIPGDNVVWEVDDIEDYRLFVDPYVEAASKTGRKLVYFRFADHEPLLSDSSGADIYVLQPHEGFENFIARIHEVIHRAGRGAIYVFDCLSGLAVDWFSDQMLGNFFMLTCPYLYDLETVAYFAIYRNYHSAHATGPIQDTTQLFLDVFRHGGDLYIRPLKVQYRFSRTMHMLHVKDGEAYRPVTASAVIAEILAAAKMSGLPSDTCPGYWERLFIEAQQREEYRHPGAELNGESRSLYDHLARMIISRDDHMLELLSQFYSLADIVNIRRRMIGTGLVGGKTVGMLLARAVIMNAGDELAKRLEEHDSFYIGSDVFYTFMVRNGVWWVRQKQVDPETFLQNAEQARRRILTGEFPDYIMKQLEEMLDYFGPSPFIVRSSSLLEDNFGNSFAGKYESVFCANQGPRQRRLEDLMAAIRTIYASTMSEKALRYRSRRGMLQHDEQMALLVMRVSGAMYGEHFFPHVAGVGFSFNPYVWNDQIDPEAGVLRLVFGLGTRAVDRSDDDYTRLVALNAPEKRPEANFDEVKRYAQNRVDYLDLEANQLTSRHVLDVIKDSPGLPMHLFATMDYRMKRERGIETWVLTFDELLAKTEFVNVMRAILEHLEKAYDYPVDIEFTASFLTEEDFRINLVQCRPLQVSGGGEELPELDEADTGMAVIEARGAVVGHSRLVDIDRFVYVVPSVYAYMPVQDRYEVARLIGRINRAINPHGDENIMLLGPGRWGTSSPSLGIPVSFMDIDRMTVVCEMVTMREDLVPDVSLGTHFLNELVEMDMLYLAMFPNKDGNRMDAEFFEKGLNQLLDVVPDAGKWQHAVRVIDVAKLPKGQRTVLRADAKKQQVGCYLTERRKKNK